MFSLDKQSAFKSFYNPGWSIGRRDDLERIAGQIATLCATLGEYPQIRYRKYVHLSVANEYLLTFYFKKSQINQLLKQSFKLYYIVITGRMLKWHV